MDIVFFTIVLLLSIGLIIFCSVLLGSAAKCVKLRKNNPKDCPVFSEPEFTKSDTIKNFAYGTVGTITGLLIMLWISIIVWLISYASGKVTSSWLESIFIVTMIIYFILHAIGITIGYKRCSKEFNKKLSPI